MREQAFVRAPRARRWIVLLSLLAVCGAAAWAAFRFPSFAVPLLLASFAPVLAVGTLTSRTLPGALRRERTASQLQAIYTVIKKAGGSLVLQDVLDSITRTTTEVTGVLGCSIKLMDPDGRSMSVRSLAGLHRQASELRAEAAESISTRSLIEGRPVLVQGAATRDFPELDSETESLICVPLRYEGKVMGALCIYGEKEKRLSPEMLSFLSRLGDLAVLSIVKATLYDSLERLDQAKSWFLRKAAHEMVSPLGVIQSLATNLLEGYLGELAPRQRQEIERMHARAAGLADVVRDLLSLARGKVQGADEARQNVDLCSLLSQSVAFFNAATREKDIALVVSTPCAPSPVHGTAEAVRSVIDNLLSNAIKYSPTGRSVHVSLVRLEAGMELMVKDRGIGIPKAERDRLSTEFFRASNARAYTESGTGLGLAVVKSELDNLGGSLDIQSEEGEGTTVRVFFPWSR
jgi:signal transduction histidine kinase